MLMASYLAGTKTVRFWYTSTSLFSVLETRGHIREADAFARGPEPFFFSAILRQSS
jgi:hypothetical protein